MKKSISGTFEKTADALLVEKHLGQQFANDFISGLIVKQYKAELLAEAKRLEAEEIANMKK